MDENEAGEARISPTRRNGRERHGSTQIVRRSPAAFFCDFTELTRVGRERGGQNERGGAVQRGFGPLQPERRGEREVVGAGGAASAVPGREEIGGDGLGEGMNLTGGPHPSAARERGGEGRGSRLGRGPGRGARGAGFWAKMAERRRGEIHFLFKFFYTKFPIEFLRRKRK